MEEEGQEGKRVRRKEATEERRKHCTKGKSNEGRREGTQGQKNTRSQEVRKEEGKDGEQ